MNMSMPGMACRHRPLRVVGYTAPRPEQDSVTEVKPFSNALLAYSSASTKKTITNANKTITIVKLNHDRCGLCQRKVRITIRTLYTATEKCTAGYLSFHPMAQCVVRAREGLARGKPGL